MPQRSPFGLLQYYDVQCRVFSPFCITLCCMHAQCFVFSGSSCPTHSPLSSITLCVATSQCFTVWCSGSISSWSFCILPCLLSFTVTPVCCSLFHCLNFFIFYVFPSTVLCHSQCAAQRFMFSSSSCGASTVGCYRMAASGDLWFTQSEVSLQITEG